MSDIEKAKDYLKGGGYTCVFCKGDIIYTSDRKGISPMLELLEKKTQLTGFSVADKIVGKAAAMLFVLSGVTEVYGEVLSKTAADFFKKNQVHFSYGTLTDIIINRKGDGMCPMEECVKDIDDVNTAFEKIKAKIDEMRVF